MATENKTRIVVVTDRYGENPHRVNITGATELTWGPWGHSLSKTDWSTGVDLEEVFLQPRAQRVIVHTYSRWDRGDGRVRGDSYAIADNDLIGHLARAFNCEELARLLPEYTDA